MIFVKTQSKNEVFLIDSVQYIKAREYTTLTYTVYGYRPGVAESVVLGAYAKEEWALMAYEDLAYQLVQENKPAALFEMPPNQAPVKKK